MHQSTVAVPLNVQIESLRHVPLYCALDVRDIVWRCPFAESMEIFAELLCNLMAHQIYYSIAHGSLGREVYRYMGKIVET